MPKIVGDIIAYAVLTLIGIGVFLWFIYMFDNLPDIGTYRNGKDTTRNKRKKTTAIKNNDSGTHNKS